MFHRRSFITAIAAATLVLAAAAGATAAEQKIKLLFMRGGGHDWRSFTPILVGVLEKTGDFDVALTENLDDLKAENINKFDVVLFYGSGRNFTDPKQEEGLGNFVRNGGGLGGIHATDAFKKSDVYWHLLGGRFSGHGGGTFPIRIVDKKHPVTAGMDDFDITDETYRNKYHEKAEIHSLVKMDRGKEQQSMAWTQDYGKGRVFNTTLGHGKPAWINPQFQRLVVRGLYWAAGREPKDP